MRKLLSLLAVNGLVWGLPAPAGAVPAQAEVIKVQFEQTGGIAGIHRTVTINSQNLSAEELSRLRRLLQDARYFEQPATFPPSQASDLYHYRITVEVDGRRHTVDMDDLNAPRELHPLIQWLENQADTGCGSLSS